MSTLRTVLQTLSTTYLTVGIKLINSGGENHTVTVTYRILAYYLTLTVVIIKMCLTSILTKITAITVKPRIYSCVLLSDSNYNKTL